MKTKQIRCGAMYGRVSDDESANRLHGSLEQQRYLAEEQARYLSESTGIPHVIQHFLVEEIGVSGATTRRPKYQELLNLIRSERISWICSKEISRLSRSLKSFCELMELAKKHNVAIHIRGLSADPTNPMNAALWQILAVIAELERTLIQERTKSSIRSAALHNQKINGGRVIKGFDCDPNRKGFWIPNEKELEQVVFLMSKFIETRSYKETMDAAKRSGIKNKTGEHFNQTSLRRLLESQKYMGRMKVPSDPDAAETWVDLHHGPVVAVELFDEVQKCISEIEEEWGKSNRSSQQIYLLTSFLEHSDGSPYSGISAKGRGGRPYRYYRCKEKSISLPAEPLEKAVLASLRIFENDERMIEIANEMKRAEYSRVDLVTKSLFDIEKSLRKLDDDHRKQWDAFRSAGSISPTLTKSFEQELARLEENRENLLSSQRELEDELEKMKGSSVDPKSLRHSLKVLFDTFERSDRAAQRGILRQIIEKVIVYDENKINVQWRSPSPC